MGKLGIVGSDQPGAAALVKCYAGFLIAQGDRARLWLRGLEGALDRARQTDSQLDALLQQILGENVSSFFCTIE